VAVSDEDPVGLPRARALILGGAVLAASGVALSGTLSQGGGGVLLVLGWLVLVVAIHRFGRAGGA
jgi:hypothetical protein